MKKLIAIFIAVFCLASIGAKANDHQLKNAYENHQSDLQVQGSGTVIHLLPDDNEGSRHQKFILKLDSKQTLLVAHNIDLAPRVPNLKVGDRVQFYGEYEWNKKGGVMHWTHNDPNNKHPHGWLKHNGKTYE
ncbi:DUF3465 domain-containing protein [Vibrio navarrensis]|uniref:DUF3465 domain-containing protein n=1 Tax=Vibrio navarrensis TaxID=29495 RepID=UPI0018675A3A|nr:DUF3465 domain-containing protein [Vibrio navarrensis]MBE3655004.1 hypothetical protein [Vibrio navarrensis]